MTGIPGMGVMVTVKAGPLGTGVVTVNAGPPGTGTGPCPCGPAGRSGTMDWRSLPLRAAARRSACVTFREARTSAYSKALPAAVSAARSAAASWNAS